MGLSSQSFTPPFSHTPRFVRGQGGGSFQDHLDFALQGAPMPLRPILQTLDGFGSQITDQELGHFTVSPGKMLS
jgi:hypothetical protein